MKIRTLKFILKKEVLFVGLLNNFFGMNPTQAKNATPVVVKENDENDVLVTAPKKPSTSAISIAPVTNDTIEIYEQLRTEAIEKSDTATADIYQTLIDEERERLEEEAKAAAKKKEEEAKAAAKKKAEEEKRRREAAEAAARKKAEKERQRLAEEAAKTELEAKTKAVESLIEYFTQEQDSANVLIEAIAGTEYGKKAILNFAATAK